MQDNRLDRQIDRKQSDNVKQIFKTGKYEKTIHQIDRQIDRKQCKRRFKTRKYAKNNRSDRQTDRQRAR